MTKLTQTSWLGGQMDVRMTGRQDMANYRNGASVLKNFVPVKLGSIRKRPGTDFAADLTEWLGENEFRMIPFGFLSGEGYVLILCPDATPKARAYKGDGAFVDVSGTIGYTSEELNQIGYVQCGDILYLAHRNHPPAEIRHDIDNTGDHTFAFADIDFNPFSDKPTISEVKMTRQHFDDFTFSDLDQEKLAYYKSNYNPITWYEGSSDANYLAYKQTYENSRISSGKTTVKYKAALKVDGHIGPPCDPETCTFGSPWTESQIVTVKFNPVAKEKFNILLYKENGGIYGLIGDCSSEDGETTIPIGNIQLDVNYTLPDHEWYLTGYSYRIYYSHNRQNPLQNDGYLIGEWTPCSTEQHGAAYYYKVSASVSHTVPVDENYCSIVIEYVTSILVDTPHIHKYADFFPSTGLNIVDDNIAPDMSETPIDDSEETPFSKAGDYPGSVGLYQQRLVWAGSVNDPARIWMSRAGDFYEYRPHVKLQLDDAIDFILPITQFANINFIVELGRLFAFSECTELVIGSASTTQGISYETIMATEHSHLGCTKRLPPIVANNTLLFVNRTGQSVRDYDEQLGSTRFGGTDVSVFATDVFAENPIVDWTWQQEPNSTVWCVLKDGRLASFTYDKEHKIAAWAVHELGGGGKARGIAKTCAVFGRDAAHPTTGEVMVAVERGEGNERRVTLERMRPWGAANDELVENRLCMDCVRETLQHEIDDDGFSAWASDPGRIPLDEYRLRDGRMAILFYRSEDDSEWIVYVGYAFESVMTTMPPVIGDQGGASQFDVKLGQHAHLRTVGSLGGEIYAVGMGDQASKIDEGAVRDGEDGAEFRDVDVVLAGSNNRDGRVTVRHDGPWPFQLALLELDYEVEG